METSTHHGGPETALRIGVGEVDVPGLLETIPFLVRQEGFCEALGVFRGERRVVIPDGGQGSIASPRWGIGGGEVNI